MKRILPLLIPGVILVLVGLVWTLQGLNVLGGSAMSGSSLWATIGPIVLVIGIAMRFSRQRLVRVVVPIAGSLACVIAALAAAGIGLTILHLVGLLLTVAVGSNYTFFFIDNEDDDPRMLASPKRVARVESSTRAAGLEYRPRRASAARSAAIKMPWSTLSRDRQACAPAWIAASSVSGDGRVIR